jgi:uroporphyrinogen decarboxylase
MKKILKIFNNKVDYKDKLSPPIWMMRQAGRYLPEYRGIRSKVNNFMELCYNPKLASEITLQPIRRFNLDAAIIFSDILVIPDAMGIGVDFIKGRGPVLEIVDNLKKLNKLKFDVNKLENVFKNIEITKRNLDSNTALIGFSGSPFTLACYIIEGSGSKDFEKVRRKIISDPSFFNQLVDNLSNYIIEYLSQQIESGVEIVKLFDSWAGILDSLSFKDYVVDPNKKIIAEVKRRYPDIPIIFFPKGIGEKYINIVKGVDDLDCLAIDSSVSRKWVVDNLQKKGVVIQGNFNNLILSEGNMKQVEVEYSDIMNNFSKLPFIFNLGHGVLPDAKISNINHLLNLLRNENNFRD